MLLLLLLVMCLSWLRLYYIYYSDASAAVSPFLESVTMSRPIFLIRRFTSHSPPSLDLFIARFLFFISFCLFIYSHLYLSSSKWTLCCALSALAVDACMWLLLPSCPALSCRTPSLSILASRRLTSSLFSSCFASLCSRAVFRLLCLVSSRCLHGI